MLTKRHRLYLPILLLLAGCGDATEPEPPFPAVAGSYAFTGTFDEPFCGADAITGTLTLVQPSRHEGTLTGSADLETVLCGSRTPLNQLVQASVSTSGQVGFQLMRPSGESVWSFAGQMQGAGLSLAGSWQIVGAGNTGTWTAHRNQP